MTSCTCCSNASLSYTIKELTLYSLEYNEIWRKQYFLISEQSMLWHSRKKQWPYLLVAHLWSFISSKEKELQKLVTDCNLFMEKSKFFLKQCVFILLTESNLKFTKTLWICQNCYTKLTCTICSRPFFHLVVYMCMHKKTKRKSEKSSVPEIKCCEGTGKTCCFRYWIWDSVYLP